ncbi:hypothetical protein [Teretinema zuelzerae]|nr:hypothetical protein [Teretinema zuelzerae]
MIAASDADEANKSVFGNVFDQANSFLLRIIERMRRTIVIE